MLKRFTQNCRTNPDFRSGARTAVNVHWVAQSPICPTNRIIKGVGTSKKRHGHAENLVLHSGRLRPGKKSRRAVGRKAWKFKFLCPNFRCCVHRVAAPCGLGPRFDLAWKTSEPSKAIKMGKGAELLSPLQGRQAASGRVLAVSFPIPARSLAGCRPITSAVLGREFPICRNHRS